MFLFSTVLWVVTEQGYKVDTALAFEQYHKMVYKLAFVRTGNTADADDILSDVFVRLIRNTDKIKSEEHLKSWLIRTTVNCSNTYYKKARRLNEVEMLEANAVTVENKENTVLPAVLSLPIHQKTVVYMYYYEGYSVEEIANLCGISKGTVKSRLARARETLKNTLKGEILDV